MSVIATTSGGELCDWCHNAPADNKPLRPVPGQRVGGRHTSRDMMVCSSCAGGPVTRQLALAGGGR